TRLNVSDLLKQYRKQNPRSKGRLDLHDIWKVNPSDAGICPFPEEINFSNPKRVILFQRFFFFFKLIQRFLGSKRRPIYLWVEYGRENHNRGVLQTTTTAIIV